MVEHPWDREDLVRRVLLALRVTGEAIASAADPIDLPAEIGGDVRPLVPAKLAGEASLLIRAAAHLADLDSRVAVVLDSLAAAVLPLARSQDVWTAVCLEPAQALTHAFGHVLLSAAGYPEARLDELLERTEHDAAVGAGRTERLPTRDLEHAWLRRVRGQDTTDQNLLARCSFGRPLDALAASAAEHYAFTHAVLYESDLGQGPVELPHHGVAADASAALGASLDAGNHDLTAELLWTWPMLGLPWNPAAVFAFTILARSQDAHGFLPGPAFRADQHATLAPDAQPHYVLCSSYHTTLVMGILCATALRRGRRPAAAVPRSGAPTGRAEAVSRLLTGDLASGSGWSAHWSSHWSSHYAGLDARQRDGLAELLLAIVLRRARATTDLTAIREALSVALHHGLVDAPAPRQAVGLLQRTTIATRMATAEPAPARLREQNAVLAG